MIVRKENDVIDKTAHCLYIICITVDAIMSLNLPFSFYVVIFDLLAYIYHIHEGCAYNHNMYI